MTLLVRGTTTHQTDLAASINLHAQPTAIYLQQNGGEHSASALNSLEGLVEGQALVLSYADTSRWTAIITIALSPLVLLLNKPRLGGHVAVE